MKMVNKITALLVLCLMGGTSFGQEDKSDLGSIELNVIDRYKGRISEAVKISRSADFIDTTVNKLPVRYKVPIQTKLFEFNPKPLKPMTISKVPVTKLPHYHVDLGFGLYGFFTFHGSAASDRSRKKQWGVDLDLWTIRTGVDDIIYSDNSHQNLRLSAHLKNILGKGKWSLKHQLNAQLQSVTYYGAPAEWFANALLADDIAAEFRSYGDFSYAARLNLLKAPKEKSHLETLGLTYGFLLDDFDGKEHRVYFDQNSKINLSGEMLDLGLDVGFVRSLLERNPTGGNTLYKVGISPSITSKYKDLRFKLGVQFGAFGNSSDSIPGNTDEVYLLPDFSAEYSFVPTYLSAFAAWSGSVELNSYSSMVNGNPFVNGVMIQQEVTRKSWIEGGIKGRIVNPLSFKILGRFTLANDLPIFYRSPNVASTLLTPGFAVIYDDMDIATIRGELKFEQKDWSIDTWVEYNNYDTDTTFAAFHLPQWQVGFNGNYQLSDQLNTGLSLAYIGSRRAFDPSLENAYIQSELPGYVDLGLNIQYNYNDYLSARLNLDNILDNNYDIWLGYQSIGFQASLTLSYRF